MHGIELVEAGPPGRDLRRRHASASAPTRTSSSPGCPRTASTTCWPSLCWQTYSPFPGPFEPGRRGLHRLASSAGSPSSRPRSGPSSGPGASTSSWRRAGGRPTRRAPGGDAGVIRMHFSGCSASCAQPQIADIGFRGDVAHVGEHLEEAVDIGLGGSLGPDAGVHRLGRARRRAGRPTCPTPSLRVVRRYQAERRPDEPFHNWARRSPNRRAASARWPSGRPQAGERREAATGIREQMNGIAEPPGKVWFWELEAGVIDADRCIQCGTCVAVCPSNSIGVDEDTDLPELVKMCTGCSLCWDFCPRGGLRYEALWPPSTRRPDEGAEVPPRQVACPTPRDTYWKITGGPPATGSARSWSAYAVRAGARLDDAQDGGAVDGPADRRCWPAGEIDGALVSKPSDDPDEPWKGVATWPPRPSEITAARRQLLQPDHGPGRAGPVALRPAGQAPHRRGRDPVRDPGDPGHAGPPLAHRRPPGRRRRADHRPDVHEELRLRGADAPGAAGQARHRPRPRVARST